MEIVGTRGQILMAKCTKIPIPYPLGAYGASTLAPSALVSAPRPFGASLLTPSAFRCLTEAKANPTSSFWRRHWSKSATFDKIITGYISKTVQDRRTVSIKVE